MNWVATRVLMVTCAWSFLTSLGWANVLLDQGQQLIDKGKFEQAIPLFTQYIDQHPTEVDGYRGRIEAQLFLRRYSDCVRDYARITAKVMPVHPDAPEQIYSHYAARLQAKPNDVKAQLGLAFAHWWYFEYDVAIPMFDHVLVQDSNNRVAVAMRASSRLLSQLDPNGGLSDLRRALAMDATNPHLRFLAADAYTYGERDYAKAFYQASRAMLGGLDTPRLHAILAVCYANFGFDELAAEETLEHISMVTSENVRGGSLHAHQTKSWDMTPGQTIVMSIHLDAGEVLDIATDGPTGTVWDTILVLLDPNGNPVASADDVIDYYAALDYTAPHAGDNKLLVTSFESVQSGTMTVSRW